MKYVILLLTLLVIVSCGSTKKKLYPGMYGEIPSSILFLPVVNKTTSAEAQFLYASTVAEPLSNSGFYVFPIEITDEFFKREGITLGDQLKGISPIKYKEMFGTDAILAVTLHKWDTNYFVIGGNVTVELECTITSAKTGNVLWNQRKVHVVPTTSNSGNILADLIITAINSATVDYVPIAQKLNMMVFGTMPFGKYHNYHLKDHDHLVQEAQK